MFYMRACCMRASPCLCLQDRHSCWTVSSLSGCSAGFCPCRVARAGECFASECKLLCDDLLEMGFSNIVIDPGVRMAYKLEDAVDMFKPERVSLQRNVSKPVSISLSMSVSFDSLAECHVHLHVPFY